MKSIPNLEMLPASGLQSKGDAPGDKLELSGEVLTEPGGLGCLRVSVGLPTYAWTGQQAQSLTSQGFYKIINLEDQILKYDWILTTSF